MSTKLGRRLRLGMVGGGPGAFIGAVHRIASRIDDQYELVAASLSSNPEKTSAAAAELHIARPYSSFQEMADAEAKRNDGIDVVAIVTPNYTHHAIAKAFLAAGIHVICDKPMTTTLADAEDLQADVERTGLLFGLTHTYSGYPMVRQMRDMCAAGDLGKLRMIQVEYAQDWLTAPVDNKQAEWRTDPERSGPGGCLGDIATHAYHLACFTSGLKPTEIAAELSTFVPGRRVDDNVQAMLRFEGGAKGSLWASQVAVGNENYLRLRLYGEKAGLAWEQENPNYLHFSPLGEPTRLLTRGGHGVGKAAAHASRVPSGHPEGYLEAFAQLYRDMAEQIYARLEQRDADPFTLTLPGVTDGVEGLRFIDAAIASSKNASAWTSLA
ncbi:MAG: Gfo/Idh/MocA family protein [Janthinobacterium lividum]